MFEQWGIGRKAEKQGDGLTAGVTKGRPDAKFVVQRREDNAFLDSRDKPIDDHTGAQTFDSEALARLYADRAQAAHSGTWRAVPAPSPTAPNEPDDHDPTAMYSQLERKAA